MNRIKLYVLGLLFPFSVTGQTISAEPNNVVVHSYMPFVIPETGPSGEAYPSHVRNDAISMRYNVKVVGVSVPAIRYDNTGYGNQGHNMDIARFSSNSLTPEIEINVTGGDAINSVTIHPVRFYPQETLKISADRRTVTFEMVENLPYAIVMINGNDPQDASTSSPQLALINDPLENLAKKPSPTAPNVLNFKIFAENYLKENPVTDPIGQMCRPAGNVTDTSLNDDRLFTWNYDAGKYVAYTSRIVAFPNMRTRHSNDLSESLQAALEKIKNTPELNTLYIPAGVYFWSGLRILNWNGNSSKGGKPLFVYTDENALMINRLKECREALEPAVYIAYSSFVTVSGRGIHDGQGCTTFATDRKDARNTPHQGGAVIKKSHNITFNDTYIRDSQQWNWETHDVADITLNNIKGLSPYNHGWLDGLNLSSGKNITVNGSITLGNDDLFATGHYNPSNEFPRRTYTENKSIDLTNTDKNSAEIRNTFAAAGIYNKDRLDWSNADSENIRVNNAIGWTRTAHCIRAGSNTTIANPGTASRGRSYYFDNFHAIVGRNANGDIRFQNDGHYSWPSYDEIVIRNSSFWAPGKNWALIPTAEENDYMIRNVVLENLYFIKPVANPSAIFSGITNLRIEKLYIGGRKIERYDASGIPEKLSRIIHFTNDFTERNNTSVQSKRRFTHPGITYTQADLDRMKAMIEAKQEPYYSVFLKLKSSNYSSLDAPVTDRGEQIEGGRFNATIGVDGRRAHDLALLWHLTGEEAYARKAVEYLNANSHYTNTSSRGTGPLDNGKIYLLIDAAEMLRDYPGWKSEDQQRFKDMLVYPGYSNTENLAAKYADYREDSKNGVTFYWNIFNFDVARFGNQGLFAARSLMAMGIYLDNEIMYDRAFRYLLGMQHREDDLPYPSGPAISSEKPIKVNRTIIDYSLMGRKKDIPDYGYDEQLQYYVYPNGQCQESSRDQGHVMAGLHNYVAIAEMTWNQGGSLYSAINNRLLLGLEWNYRYNLSKVQSYEDQLTPWEPTGSTKNINEATYENGKYLQIKSRSGRWESVEVSPSGRGDVSGTGGTREMALAHYAVRAGLSSESYTWLRRYRDYMIEHHGPENWGVAPNWFYEWTGWGTLTKRLTPWMAGDPGSFAGGKRVSGLHRLPGTIRAADYDYYCISENPEGHTYHNKGTVRGNQYRPDGAIELKKEADGYVVTRCEDGEWMNYTVGIPVAGVYTVSVVYQSKGQSVLSITSDQGTNTTKTNNFPSSKQWKEKEVGELPISAGACVLRLNFDKAGEELSIREIVVR